MSALTKWNPFRHRQEMDLWRPMSRWDSLRDMEREMALMWDRMDRMFGQWPAEMEGSEMFVTSWSPRVDVLEDEKEYTVKAELPEVRKDQISVTVRDGMLTICGERRAEKEEKGKKYHRVERAYGSFERSFSVPADADPSRVTSGFKDGVLSVHLPKNPAATPKQIAVKVD